MAFRVTSLQGQTVWLEASDGPLTGEVTLIVRGLSLPVQGGDLVEIAPAPAAPAVVDAAPDAPSHEPPAPEPQN